MDLKSLNRFRSEKNYQTLLLSMAPCNNFNLKNIGKFLSSIPSAHLLCFAFYSYKYGDYLTLISISNTFIIGRSIQHEDKESRLVAKDDLPVGCYLDLNINFEFLKYLRLLISYIIHAVV